MEKLQLNTTRSHTYIIIHVPVQTFHTLLNPLPYGIHNVKFGNKITMDSLINIPIKT